MFENKTILVTGGTGSWGYELVKQLLELNPKKVIVFSRNENNQVLMSREFTNKNLQFYIGDIRDKAALTTAMTNVDYVFHLAALKHVSTCEDYPLEALKTNVIGTTNIIDAAIFNKVKKVINVSTDKAVDPANFYGMTKALAEKIIIQANVAQSHTKFICVRGGNVFGSNGSVLQLFIDQIHEAGKIQLTDKKMTRFFITPENAIKLLIEAATIGIGGETFIMNMKACKIIDLASVLIEHFQTETEIVEIGARPGEKFHELLVSDGEKKDAVWLGKDLIVALPSYKLPALIEYYQNHRPLSDISYSSEESIHLMNKEDIKDILLTGHFIN